jgi:catechol 2,3-dioxygenase-like lactoylglutathione lyase family enzyme
MVRTHGLTHIALAVKEAERSLRLYRKVFGVKLVYRENGFIQAQTPGSRDVLVFEENAPGPESGAGSLTSDFASPILMISRGRRKW